MWHISVHRGPWACSSTPNLASSLKGNWYTGNLKFFWCTRMTHCTDGVRFTFRDAEAQKLLWEKSPILTWKISPVRDWRSTSLEWLSSSRDLDLGSSTPLCIREPSNFKVAWHKNWDKYQKSGRIKFRYCALFLRVSGHLPAPIVNGGGDRLRKVQFSELQKPRDLAIGSGHMAYRRASLINLHTKFHWNCKKNFLWMDGCTDVRMEIPTDGISDPL